MILSNSIWYCISVARSFPHAWTYGTPCLMKIRRIHFAGSALVMPSRDRMSRGVRRVPPQSGSDGRGGCALSKCEALADLPAAGALNCCEAAARCFGGAFVAMLMETLGCRCLDDCIAAGAAMVRRRGAGLLERDDLSLIHISEPTRPY